MAPLADTTARWARAHAHSADWTGLSLGYVRRAYGAPRVHDTSMAAWHAAEYKHYVGTPLPGSVVFWLGGRDKQGLTAIADYGNRCWVVGALQPDRADLVDIDFVTTEFGLVYLGWSEDVNGVRAAGLVPKKDTATALLREPRKLRVDPAKVAIGLNGYDADWKLARLARPGEQLEVVRTVTHNGLVYAATRESTRYRMDYLVQ